MKRKIELLITNRKLQIVMLLVAILVIATFAFFLIKSNTEYSTLRYIALAAISLVCVVVMVLCTKMFLRVKEWSEMPKDCQKRWKLTTDEAIFCVSLVGMASVTAEIGIWTGFVLISESLPMFTWFVMLNLFAIIALAIDYGYKMGRLHSHRLPKLIQRYRRMQRLNVLAS